MVKSPPTSLSDSGQTRALVNLSAGRPGLVGQGVHQIMVKRRSWPLSDSGQTRAAIPFIGRPGVCGQSPGQIFNVFPFVRAYVLRGESTVSFNQEITCSDPCHCQILIFLHVGGFQCVQLGSMPSTGAIETSVLPGAHVQFFPLVYSITLHLQVLLVP